MSHRSLLPAVGTPDAVRQALIRKGFAPAARMISPPSLLTFPRNDLQGEFVVPEGIHWTPRPFVNLDHGPPVGWALEVPTLKSIKSGDSWVNVPVGQSKFFETMKDLEGANLNILDAVGNPTGKMYSKNDCLHAADQCAALVEHRIMDGVSLEFISEESHHIGYSHLLGRSARKHTKSLGVGWAHTDKPVNPDARLLIEERAKKALEAPGLSEYVKKSLTRILAGTPRTTAVRGNWEPTEGTTMANRLAKAIPTDDENMEDDEMVADTVANDDVPAEIPGDDVPSMESDPDAEGPPPAVKTFLAASQGLMDMCDAHSVGMKKSDNPQARRKWAKFCMKLKKLATEAQAIADGHAEELAASDADAMADSDEADDEGGEDEPDEDDMEVDDGDDDEVIEKSLPDTDGEGYVICKSYPHYRAGRLRHVKELRPPVQKKARKPVDDDGEEYVRMKKTQFEAWRTEVAKLRGDD